MQPTSLEPGKPGLSRRLVAFFRRPPAALGLLVLLLALGWGGFMLHRHRQFHQHLEAARQAEVDFDFRTAHEQLADCVRLRPADPEARLRLARIARRMDDYSTAAAELDVYEDLAGADGAAAVLERAMLAAQQGDLVTTRPMLMRFMAEQHPETALVLEALVKGSMANYRLDAAQSYNEILLDGERDNIPALLRRGRLAEMMGNPDKALSCYQEAVAWKPDNLEARLLVAEALLSLHRATEMLEPLEQLYARSPRPEVALVLARCCRIVQQPERAAALLDGILQQAPKFVPVLAERGRVALDMDDLPKAEEVLRRAADLMPSDQQVHRDLAVCLSLQGKATAARAESRIADQISKEQIALAHAMVLTQKQPNDPQPRWDAAMVYVRLGQDREALRWFLGTLQIAPEHRPTHEALAALYDRLKQPNRAEPHREFLKAHPAPQSKPPTTTP
jgi:tetratricopeptide (TPR) repeat protein